jgi:hypothetical protein
MSSANTRDKIICAFLYTAKLIPLLAWGPIIWLVVANIKKIYLKDFIRYHCYQALLVNMLIFFLPHFFVLLMSFVTNLLDILVIFGNSVQLLNLIQNWVLKFYDIGSSLVIIYAFVWTIRGRFTYIPSISQAVNLLLR